MRALLLGFFLLSSFAHAEPSCSSDLRASERLRSLAGYGMLLGGMAANAAVSAGVLTAIDSQMDFTPAFAASLLGQTSFISVSLLAPFLEPIASRIRRFTFALKTPTDQSSLENLADRTQATYTLREQHSTDRILTLRNALRLNFEGLASAIEHDNRDRAVSELVDAVLLAYRHFRDLRPDDPTLVGASRALGLGSVAGAQEIRAQALARLVPLSVEEPDSEGARHYFSLAVEAWLP